VIDREAGEEAGWAPDLWFWRWVRWLRTAARPYLGWSVLLTCLGLAALPVLLLYESGWVRGAGLQARLAAAAVIAVVVPWSVLGWRSPATWRPRWFRIAINSATILLLTLILISELLLDWFPSSHTIWQAGVTQQWQPLLTEAGGRLQQAMARYGIWWQGVQANSAGRDELIVATVAAIAIWVLATFMVLLVRRFRQGLLAALPVLWPLGFIMLYSPAERWLIVLAVWLALLLHLLLDQQRLVAGWRSAHLDYSPSLLLERFGVAIASVAMVLAVAQFTPNLYIRQITSRYYELLKPFNQNLEAAGKRLFPGLAGVVPWGGQAGIAGGLPNQFLLARTPEELSERIVMRVRTSEPTSGYSGYPEPAPRGHALRGATFADYDGRGWSNLPPLQATRFAAEEPWTRTLAMGRRPLVQSVNLAFNSSVIYAAGEPETPSVDYMAEEHFSGDLVALRGQVRSYAVTSQLPALSPVELAALPAWDAVLPLPEEYGIYRALPATVTQRTRDLAEVLTADAGSMFAKASAIEGYLREYTYDLTVSAPPADVADVADYFLFDLRRGYCDYYATAFVVLARAAGLPARFVTGFTTGSWDPMQRLWVVDEGDAHSWPEVYFPEVGWVPFEPTGGLPPLERVGQVDAADAGLASFEPLPPPVVTPDWLPLLWLLPLALVGGVGLAIVRRWRAAHEDPWLGLLRWGHRAGRPYVDGDTVLEYGKALAEHVQEEGRGEVESRRVVAREVRVLSEDVSALRYAPNAERADLQGQIAERWRRLRLYLRQIRP
jgi:transglutaminase-like putative cysteine protease